MLEELQGLTNKKKNPAENISKAEWQNYYSQLNSKSVSEDKEAEILLKLKELEEQNLFTELDYIITEGEIRKALSKLKNGKSPGLDSICPEMLKYNQEELIKPLTKLYNIIFSNSLYPIKWSEGFITPLFKKDNPNQPDNYRGITITSSIAKVFNYVLNNRLISFLTKHGIIKNSQIGFMKGSRTSDHIFTLKTLIDKYTKQYKRPLYACFVDFQKAFDKVWHNALFLKLRQVGMGNLFLNIIKSMYNGTKLGVRTGNSLTDFLALVLE